MNTREFSAIGEAAENNEWSVDGSYELPTHRGMLPAVLVLAYHPAGNQYVVTVAVFDGSQPYFSASDYFRNCDRDGALTRFAERIVRGY